MTEDREAVKVRELVDQAETNINQARRLVVEIRTMLANAAREAREEEQDDDIR
jgi:hypothetical protein